MILPTKRVSEDRALLTIGARILDLLDRPKTVSRIWEEYKNTYGDNQGVRISYDWFVLALDLLYILEAIDRDNGRIYKNTSA